MWLTFGNNIWLALPIVASAGLLSGLSPCTLPTAFLVASYVGRANSGRRQGFVLSLTFVIGTAITWSVLGSFAGFMGSRWADAWSFKMLLSGVLLFTGLWMLGFINLEGVCGLKLRPGRGSGIVGALLLGLLLAVTASPCTLPVALSVMAFASTQGSAAYGTLLMLVFAVSRGIPLILVGTFSAWVQRLKRFAKYQSFFEQAAGWFVVALGLYYLLT